MRNQSLYTQHIQQNNHGFYEKLSYFLSEFQMFFRLCKTANIFSSQQVYALNRYLLDISRLLHWFFILFATGVSQTEKVSFTRELKNSYIFTKQALSKQKLIRNQTVSEQ